MGEDQALYLRLMEQYNTKLAAALGFRPAAAVEAVIAARKVSGAQVQVSVR